MKGYISNVGQPIKIISIIGCLTALASCATPHWRQGYDLADKVKELAGAGKCDAAIKSYDKLKAEYLDVRDLHNQVASVATSGSNYGKKPFSTCLLENGRAEEVIAQYELACLPNQRTHITAQYQTFICTEYGLKSVAAPAYKMLGRENPFEKNPDIATQVGENLKYISQVDAAISNIYKRLVTQKTGTPTETRRYYSQMMAAATESIAFLDTQTPNCQAKKNSLCLKFLAEKRQEQVTDLAVWNAKLKESKEDHAAAQRIAEITPAIIGAITKIGANEAAGANVNVPSGFAPGNATYCLRSEFKKTKTDGLNDIAFGNSCPFTIVLYACSGPSANLSCYSRGPIRPNKSPSGMAPQLAQGSRLKYGACKGERQPGSFFIKNGASPDCDYNLLQGGSIGTSR